MKKRTLDDAEGAYQKISKCGFLNHLFDLQLYIQYKLSSIIITNFRERGFANNITIFQINFICSIFIGKLMQSIVNQFLMKNSSILSANPVNENPRNRPKDPPAVPMNVAKSKTKISE